MEYDKQNRGFEDDSFENGLPMIMEGDNFGDLSASVLLPKKSNNSHTRPGYVYGKNIPLEVLMARSEARYKARTMSLKEKLAKSYEEDGEENKLTRLEEFEVNLILQAGIPASIVGSFGTTLGTKVIWNTFGEVISRHYGVKAATALGLTVGDGLLPIGDAIAAGLLISTAWGIARNWDKLWQEAEQILVQQEPEAQIYTTPTDEQVDTQRTTGHKNPKVETGTPGYESPELDTPNHTGGELEQPDAEDFIMESQVDQDFNDPEVRRRDDIAHGGYYTRKNLRKLVQEGTVSQHDSKHLKARTEEQARRLSQEEAQYLPGINNGALEREALLKGKHFLRRSSRAFWNFYRSDDYVGYDKGVKTRWIRAEYSSGVIHGHPMNPKRLSKYVKNPTP